MVEEMPLVGVGPLGCYLALQKAAALALVVYFAAIASTSSFHLESSSWPQTTVKDG
jgi:hypothetical protein